MISFKISIFALSNTTGNYILKPKVKLWLALKLVSLHYQIQPSQNNEVRSRVVISFKISIFALSNTTYNTCTEYTLMLWLALKLVSLHYQIQLIFLRKSIILVVISFKISIFALSNTTLGYIAHMPIKLWLALKLVSLHYQIQP